MRFLFWCSAGVVLLAGCGRRPASPDPFAYDRGRPLAVRDAGSRSPVRRSQCTSSRTRALGGCNAFLIVPRAPRPPSAVLFLHGSGGNREDLLLTAVELASRGAVTMTISQPNDATTFRPLVVNARRALDVLAGERTSTAATRARRLLARRADRRDPRRRRAAPEGVGIVSGRGEPVPDALDPQVEAALFLQAGQSDAGRPPASARAADRRSSRHPRVRWYETGHG